MMRNVFVLAFVLTSICFQNPSLAQNLCAKQLSDLPLRSADGTGLLSAPTEAFWSYSPISERDLEAMRISRINTDMTWPREYGYVQLKNEMGEVLAESGLVPGVSDSILLNGTVFQLLTFSEKLANEVGTLVIVHTHPNEYSRSNGFSDADRNADRDLLSFITEAFPKWKHLNIESYIVYFVTGSYIQPGKITEYELNKGIRKRGYKLRSKN